jgi:hypothetical protein
LFAIPLLAIFLLGCSKEGEAVNPKAKEKIPNIKPAPAPGVGGPGGEKGGAPAPD